MDVRIEPDGTREELIAALDAVAGGAGVGLLRSVQDGSVADVIPLNMPGEIPTEAQSSALAAFCRWHNIVRLSLFGSVLHRDDRPGSDIDILIEFPSGQTPSLLDLGGMLMELREIFGRDVDLKTPGFLSRFFRDQVMREARTLHAA